MRRPLPVRSLPVLVLVLVCVAGLPLAGPASASATSPADAPTGGDASLVESPATVGTPATRHSSNETVVLRDGGSELTFAPTTNQTVRGETSLPPGSALAVHLRVTGPVSVLQIKSTSIRENGTFRATFDLSHVAVLEEAPVTVSVRRDGTTLAAAEGTVRPPESESRSNTLTGSPTATESPGTDTAPFGTSIYGTELGATLGVLVVLFVAAFATTLLRDSS